MIKLELLQILLLKQITPAIASTNSFLVITLTAPMAPPAAREPVSPINIFAGGALNHKKPKPAPTNDAQKYLLLPFLRCS